MVRHVKYLRIELTVTLAFFFSVLLLTLYLSSVGLHSSRVHYYALYAQSLAQGHLWVQEAASYAQCAYDLSFYKGRCYLYWGIFPALLHWALPFVSDRVVTLIACSCGLYFLLKTLSAVTFRKRRTMLERIAMPLYLFVAFGTNLPALCLAARVYEEAIAVAYAWGFAGLYLALPVLFDEEDATPTWRRPLAASVCFVMAGLCRLSWMGLALLLSLWLVTRPIFMQRSLSWKRVFAALVPVILGCSLQLYLNYQRFEDPLDFGISRQTFNVEVLASGRKVTSIEYMGANFIYNFFAGLPPSENPLRNKSSDAKYPLISRWFHDTLINKEFALGLFVLMPSLLLGIPLLWRLRQEQKLQCLGPACLALPLALSSLAINGEVYRYQLEIYLPLLLLLIPPLLVRTARRQALSAVHWLSFLIPLPLTLFNTLWVVKMVCHRWGQC